MIEFIAMISESQFLVIKIWENTNYKWRKVIWLHFYDKNKQSKWEYLKKLRKTLILYK